MVSRTDAWFDGKTYIPFEKMTPKRLQNAKIHAQRKELLHHNKCGVFAQLVDNLDAEAERRGIQLKDYDSEYHENTRKYKNKIHNNESLHSTGN